MTIRSDRTRCRRPIRQNSLLPARGRFAAVRITTAATLLLALLPLFVTGCANDSGGPDTTPPAQVRGLLVSFRSDTSVMVYWLENNDRDLSHYLLYAGTDPDSLSTDGVALTTNSKLVEDLTIGTTYWFGVTAVDEAGNEGEVSRLTDATPINAEWEVSAGWEDFQAEAYADALLHFAAAAVREGTHAPAYLGEGWCRAFLDELDAARISFLQANSLGLSSQHANAGLSLVYRELGTWNEAITRAETVLNHNPAWALPWRTSIDFSDLRLTIAQCAYRLGESHFDEVQAQVDILDPDNGLAPGDPATWIVADTACESYGAALLMLLVELEVTIGG